jgi:uncharacterized protein (DUF1778 family)
MTARIDIRPSDQAKARLDRAASRLGLPLSAFVLAAALERAQEVLARDDLLLSDRDRDRIVALLAGKARAPNKALRQAARRHAALVARSED